MTTTSEPLQPNMFDLKGHDVRVHYSTSSIAGVPLLSFESKDLQRSFRGDEIRVQETELGHLVSVTLELVPDLHAITFSVLIPSINLEGRECEIQTEGIRALHRTSIAGPRLVKGQVSSYESVTLRGKAQSVVF